MRPPMKSLAGKWDGHFPLESLANWKRYAVEYELNEVIANRGNEMLKEKGSDEKIHPNDDVNMGQSSNDTFPTAMHVAVVQYVEKHLIPEIKKLRETLSDKASAFKDIVKIGRTHLQDATP